MPSQLTAWYPADAVRSMLAQAEDVGPLETGGVLLGYVLQRDWVVRVLVGPGPNAVHGAAGFLPDAPWQEARITEAYELSGRRLEYLGDWHTHPLGRPTPSLLDRRTLRAIARTRSARCPRPLMAILAGSAKDGWTLASYVDLPRGPRRSVRAVMTKRFDDRTPNTRAPRSDGLA